MARHVELRDDFNVACGGSAKDPFVVVDSVITAASGVCERTRTQHCHQPIAFVWLMTPITSNLHTVTS